MREPVVPSNPTVDLDAARRLDPICDRFEDDWVDGRRPRLEDFLDKVDEADRPALLRELLALEFYHRAHRGEHPRAEEYYPRLPGHADLIDRLSARTHDSVPRLTIDDVSPPRPNNQAGSESPSSSLQEAAAASGYEIQRELGRGGMGVVYLAHDRKRRVPIALKTLPRLDDPAALLRFKTEFRALVNVAHPNLVTLHELKAEGPTWFFTMDYVQGADWLRHVRTGPESSRFDRLRETLRQLAEGVSALHAAGKLHRDVKPSNVLVDLGGRVVLLDFGLVAELDPQGRHQGLSSGIVGTLMYMAPEQMAGLPVSAASDWYSVGVMLYEALTGQTPFRGGPLQLLRDKQDIDPPPPHDRAADVPEDLDALCMELLRRDPEARPTGRDVLLRLGRKAAGSPPPVPSRPPFVGRQAHLRILDEAFREMQQGRTAAVHLHGPSGAGKSALVQHFLDGLGERGDVVLLQGRCYEQESVPYKALDSLIDDLSRYLGRLSSAEVWALLPRDVHNLSRVFPVLRRVQAVADAPARPGGDSPDPHEARRRAAVALRDLLARLGDRQPLVLFIDDLQWGDLDSVPLLSELFRPPDAPALLFLGCYRSEEAAGSPFLRAYIEQQGSPACRDLAVESLTAAEARDLALTLLDRPAADARAQAEAIAHESRGNPFFVHELVQHVHGSGSEGGEQREVALDQVLWERILRLPEGARRLIEALAVAGRSIRQADVCQAAGVLKEPAALAALRSGRLVRLQRDEIDISHDRIRETVLAHVVGAALIECHRRLAETLEAGGATDPEVLAVHFHGAGQTERASRAYAAAGDQTADALAFEHAARLYRQALELRVCELTPPPNPLPEAERGRKTSGSPSPLRGGGGGGGVASQPLRAATGQDENTLRTRLGDALANAGRGEEEAREYLTVAGNAAAAQTLEYRRRAGLQFLISGHVDEGIRTLRPVLEAVGMRLASTPSRALLALLFRRAQLWLRGLGFRERVESQAPAEDLARIDFCWTTTIGLSLIDPIRGAAFQAHGLLMALNAGEPFRIARALAVEAGFLVSAGGRAKRRGLRLLEQAGALARRLDHPYALAFVTFGEGVIAHLQGNWRTGLEKCDRAEQFFRDRCVGVAWELDSARAFSLWGLNSMGETAELSRRWHTLVQDARKRGDLFALTNLRTFNMAIVRLAADDPEKARRDLAEAVGAWSQAGYHLQHHNALLAQVSIELYSGNAQAAWEQVAKNAPAFRQSLLGRIKRFRIQMLQMRAYSALAATVDAADPEPLLRVAAGDARRLRREQFPWPAALDRYIRAVVAFRRGDAVGTRGLLGEAAAAFEAIDMRLFAAAARRRLGELLGGDEGRALVGQADAWMAGQNIQNPPRMTAVFAPGFPA